MRLSGSANKLFNLQLEITPIKITVDYEINSWNETHSKQQVVYRHKRRKMLRTIEENQVKQQKKSNNFEKLRTYKENLLKSTAKKLSERTLPSVSTLANSYPSVELKKSGSKKFNFNIRSLTRSNHEQKPIVISQFDPNAEADLHAEEIRQQRKTQRLMINGVGNQPSSSLSKRGNALAGSLRSAHSQTINAECRPTNPQSIGFSLVSRRLIGCRI